MRACQAAHARHQHTGMHPTPAQSRMRTRRGAHARRGACDLGDVACAAWAGQQDGGRLFGSGKEEGQETAGSFQRSACRVREQASAESRQAPGAADLWLSVTNSKSDCLVADCSGDGAKSIGPPTSAFASKPAILRPVFTTVF